MVKENVSCVFISCQFICCLTTTNIRFCVILYKWTFSRTSYCIGASTNPGIVESNVIFEPRCEMICLRCFCAGPTQTRLYYYIFSDFGGRGIVNICSENKGADQLRGYLHSLHFWFSTCKYMFSHDAAKFVLKQGSKAYPDLGPD